MSEASGKNPVPRVSFEIPPETPVAKHINQLADKALAELQRAYEEHRSAFEDFSKQERKLKHSVECAIANVKWSLMEHGTQKADCLESVAIAPSALNLKVQTEGASDSQGQIESATYPAHGAADVEASQVSNDSQDMHHFRNDAKASKTEDFRFASGKETKNTDTFLGAAHLSRYIQERVVMDGADARPPEEYEEARVHGTMQETCLLITRGGMFEVVCTMAIIVNAAILVTGIEYSARYYYKPELAIFEISETFFLIFYVAEQALRMAAQRQLYFTGSDRGWHLFDLCLILCAVPDRIVAFLGASSTANLTFMRILRMLRMLKIGRIGRIARKSFHVRILLSMFLRLIMIGLPLVLFMASVSAVFSVCILSMVGSFLQDEWRVIDQELTTSLVQNWGSMRAVMFSCFMATTGGTEWAWLSQNLREVGEVVYVVFLCFILFYIFVGTNVVTCIFVHIMMVCADNADKFKVSVQIQRAERFVKVFTGLLGATELTYHAFYQQMVDDQKINNFLRNVMGISSLDAEFLFYSLSASGTETVSIETFILGCIELKSPVTKMDLMQTTSNIDVALEEYASQHQASTSTLLRKGTSFVLSESVDNDTCIRVKSVNVDGLLSHIQSIAYRIPEHDRQHDFSKACLRMIEIVRCANGGCGFLLTTSKGFASMRHQGIDFQAVDRDSRHPLGYMSQRLRESNLQSQEFMDVIKDFTCHSDNDRWPEGHEASGLPKDGYIIMSTSGKTLKAAARIVGLPKPPFRWDGVGTRHLAALSVSWVLRLHPSLVVVRSDSGKIHWLSADGNFVNALELVNDDRQIERSSQKIDPACRLKNVLDEPGKVLTKQMRDREFSSNCS